MKNNKYLRGLEELHRKYLLKYLQKNYIMCSLFQFVIRINNLSPVPIL